MRHIKVRWIHDFEEEPILLYSEVDDEGYEVRKVNVFRDGKVGIASAELSFGDAELSSEVIPENSEIESDPQFALSPLTKEEFEEEWKKYVGTRQ